MSPPMLMMLLQSTCDLTMTVHSDAADLDSTVSQRDEGVFLAYLPTAEAYSRTGEILIRKEGAVSHLVIGDLTAEPIAQCLSDQVREIAEEFRATRTLIHQASDSLLERYTSSWTSWEASHGHSMGSSLGEGQLGCVANKSWFTDQETIWV